MKIILIVLGIILLLSAIIMLLPVRVIVEYSGKTRLRIFVYGIMIFDSVKKPQEVAEQKESKECGNEESSGRETDYITLLKENFEFLKEILKEIVEKTKKYAIIKNIEAKYKFGLGDAAVTGIYSGVVYAVVNGFAAFIRNYYTIKNQRLEVIPDFDNKVQEFNAKIEIVIRAAFFVPTLLRLIKIFKGKEEV